MINRIRDIRREKHLTLADVAARCAPPTTAQTIGRLETGTRNLSLVWMNRIAAALDVEPELLLRGQASIQPRCIARLTDAGAEALSEPRDAILPTALGGEAPLLALAIEASAGEYRASDHPYSPMAHSGQQSPIACSDERRHQFPFHQRLQRRYLGYGLYQRSIPSFGSEWFRFHPTEGCTRCRPSHPTYVVGIGLGTSRG